MARRLSSSRSESPGSAAQQGNGPTLPVVLPGDHLLIGGAGGVIARLAIGRHLGEDAAELSAIRRDLQAAGEQLLFGGRFQPG